MPSFTKQHISRHTPRELYALVADIKRYPEFLPWVTAARLHKDSPEHKVAELKIRFSAISASYTSDVTLTPPTDEHAPCAIDVRLVKGPFKTLTNNWEFTSAEGGGTLIHFSIDFAFQSAMFERVIGGLFEKATHKMVTAFEQRADQLYGNRG